MVGGELGEASNTGSETADLAGLDLPEDLFYLFPTWERLESRSRSDEFEEGLQARTADPLWYIARQWQLGELQAEDAGSLCYVRLDCETEQVTHYALGKTQAYTGLPPQHPLEVLVEQEPIPCNWRMRLRVGQQFERYIRETLKAEEHDIENIIQDLYKQFPVELSDSDEKIDAASRRLIKMVAGKAIDGKALLDNRQSPRPELDGAWGKLGQWYEELFATPDNTSSSAWQTESLDYHFKTKTGRDTELASEHYRNGDLEWYSANHVRDGVESAGGSDCTPSVSNLLPTRVSFGGAPHPRWWVMEDRNVNLGDLDTAKSELINTMFMHFALIHGDDWFVVPLNLPVGSLTLVKKVITTDVFGVELKIFNGRVNDPDPLRRWDLFSLAQNADPRQNADRDYLYIPPSSGFREESEALEEVNFIRDEQANLVFAIEKTMLNGWGKPVSIYDYYLEQERLAELQRSSDTTDEANANGATNKPQLRYKLATDVPENWIPYMAEKIEAPGNLSQTFLQQARLPDVSESLESGPFAPPKPMTRVLKESSELNEEAIPRSGLQVKLNAQRLRWIDGKTYVWVGRKVLSANRERSSGLEFDVISFENGVANGS